MTRVYTQHTVTQVAVGPTNHQHERQRGGKAEDPTYVECDACAPFLLGMGWKAVADLDWEGTGKGVSPTDRQVAARERAEREGNAAVHAAAEALVNVSRRATDEAVRPARGRRASASR